MSDRTAVHETFRIERTYPVRPSRVWRALADEQAKAIWFAGPPEEWQVLERAWDFRVGGHERLRGRWPSGTVSDFNAWYHDIVEGERIVYAYTMHIDGRQISVSLGTMEIAPDGDGARLVYTEQGVFLDGLDTARQREEGTRELLDALGRSLTQAA